MVSGVKIGRDFAVLKFEIGMPSATKAGHVFAFGPQEKIAEMARLIAQLKSNRDVTLRGFPKAVMLGYFLSKEEATNLPHLSPL